MTVKRTLVYVTLTAAALFDPLRHRVQTLTNSRFHQQES
jgi:hypothetical protein